jgi:hypothetical protein
VVSLLLLGNVLLDVPYGSFYEFLIDYECLEIRRKMFLERSV